MKGLIILLFSIFSFLNLSAQCDGTIVTEILDDYTDIAEKLAVPYSAGLFPDSVLVTEILEGMSSIFLTEGIAEVDSVFNIYCINSYFYPFNGYYFNLGQYQFDLDTTVAWTQNWLNGDQLSGNAAIDSLFQDLNYLLQLSPPFGEPILRISDNVNFQIIEDFLNMQAGVNSATFYPGYGGGGNLIMYSKTNGIQYFDFILGWGDCPAGCNWYRTWSFSVDADCTVSFLGASGDNVNPINIPDANAPQVNCRPPSSIRAYALMDDIILSNNPFQDVLVFSIEDVSVNDLSYSLIDADARTVMSGELKPFNGINTSHLSSGMYLLALEKEGHIIGIKKVIKSQ